MPVDRRVADARLEELEPRRQQWQTELDQCDDLLSGLAQLWSALRLPGNISVVNEITRSLPRPAADKPLSSIIAGVGRAAQDKALVGFPARLVRSIAEGTDAIDRDGLRLALDDGFEQPLPRRLALALLDDRVENAKLEPLAAALGDGEVEQTVNELVEAARSASSTSRGGGSSMTASPPSRLRRRRAGRDRRHAYSPAGHALQPSRNEQNGTG